MKKLLLSFIVLFCLSLSSHAQGDSIGVYAFNGSTYEPMRAIHYQKIKIGFGTASNVFAGKTSEHVFEKQAKFRLYFGHVPTDRMVECFCFSSDYSIKDFGIGEFKAKKDSRHMGAIQGFLLNVQTGTKLSKNVEVKTNTIREGVYELTITGKPGEYGIMLLRNGVGSYLGVYDFTLK